MLKLVPENTKIPFLHYRKAALIFSGLLMVASLVLFLGRGLNMGIDFAGGIMIHIETPQTVDIGQVRGTIDALDLGDVSIQEFGDQGNEALIRIESQGDEAADQVAIEATQEALGNAIPGVLFQRVEKVGSKVSGELIQDGVLAVTIAVIAVLIYIWFRFEWHFGIGAVIALIHDVILTIGFFSLTGLEFNLSIIAAILTIVGYSLNDTVVVYDRIRENLRKFRKMKLEDLLNLSVNNTLSRTLMTSLTTLIALVSLFVFGGAVIRGFTAAMIWGVFVGTYSSIFIAAPALIYLKLKRTDVTAEEAGS